MATGYGRERELGLLQHQVMTVFDFMLEDNIPAAKDALALLAVAIDQSCLDGGRMDLATLLTLQEDPPIAIFQNRQLSSTSWSRSFAPLADQRWNTCSLAFLKQVEVIASKRLELTGVSSKGGSETSSENPKRKRKGSPEEEGERKGPGSRGRDRGLGRTQTTHGMHGYRKQARLTSLLTFGLGPFACPDG